MYVLQSIDNNVIWITCQIRRWTISEELVLCLHRTQWRIASPIKYLISPKHNIPKLNPKVKQTPLGVSCGTCPPSSSHMMTSSNGNFFHVTGHLCGEFTGHRWIPRTQRPVTRILMLSLIWARINGWVNNREAGDLRRHCAHYGVTNETDRLSSIFHDRWTHAPHITRARENYK